MVRTLPTLLLLAGFHQVVAAGPTQTLQLAAGVLGDLTSSPNGIPPAQLADAYGVAVFPRVVKAGLLVGGSSGQGVLLVRGQQGEWGDPAFVTFGGASLGLQAGAESADVVLVLQTRASLDRLLAGKRTIAVGAVAGPRAKQMTDGTPGAEILTYSRGRGLSVGVSVSGLTLRPDTDANKAFSRDTSPEVRELVGAVQARLPRAHGPGGRVYHSRRQPTIRVDGRELVVGFSDHALRQVYERTAFDWRTYAGAGHASMYLGSCDYFEDVSHLFGYPCFAVFGLCVPGHVGGQLARFALGRAVEAGDRLYYRVGYCPAVVEGRFLKAKTLLLPGMKGTPESRAVAAARLTPAERTEFHSRYEAFAAPGRRGADMLRVLLEFHRLGVPQVVRIDRPVFHLD